MKTIINSKFNSYYELHCKHLKLKGLQPKTIEAYSRAIRLACIIKEYEKKFKQKYKKHLLPSQLKALAVMKI